MKKFKYDIDVIADDSLKLPNRDPDIVMHDEADELHIWVDEMIEVFAENPHGDDKYSKRQTLSKISFDDKGNLRYWNKNNKKEFWDTYNHETLFQGVTEKVKNFIIEKSLLEKNDVQ